MSRCPPLAAIYWFSIETIGKTHPPSPPAGPGSPGVTSPDSLLDILPVWLLTLEEMLWSALVYLSRVNPGILPPAGITLRPGSPGSSQRPLATTSQTPAQARERLVMAARCWHSLLLRWISLLKLLHTHPERLSRFSSEDRGVETLEPREI